VAKAPTDIRSLARSHTHAALRTLKGVMGQKTAPAAARVSAAVALLERGWGKPDATLNVKGDMFSQIIGLVQGLDNAKPEDEEAHTLQ